MCATLDMPISRSVVGVDVSMKTLDYCLESGKSSQIKNELSSIRAWIAQLPSQVLVVFEPTGTYSDKLQRLLEKNSLDYSLVTPYQSRSFAQAIGQSNKTDTQDALTLLKLGKSLALSPSKVPSKKMRERKQILSSLNALQKQEQQLNNQIHALEQHLEIVQPAMDSLDVVLQSVQQQIEVLEEQLSSYTDQREKQVKALMLSVIGIGPKSADLLCHLTDCLDNFETDKQLVKFVGTAPRVYQSGSSVQYRGRISKKGNSILRSTLYMAARSAKIHNPECNALYLRLREKGKPHKVAMIAVVNKMLRQVFAVVKSNTNFDKNYLKKEEKN